MTSWEASRNARIGGTDISCLLGFESYKTTLAIWARLVGRAPSLRRKASPNLKWGNRLEPAVIEAYAEDTGRRVRTAPVGEALAAIRQHCDLEYSVDDRGERRTSLLLRNAPHKVATCDCFVDSYVRPAPRTAPMDVSGFGVMDAKTTEGRRKLWRPGVPVPPYELCQLQWYLGLTGAEWGSVGVFVGLSEELVIRDVPRNDKLVEMMHEAVDRFWVDHVEPKRPPDYIELTEEVLQILYPASTDEHRILPVEPFAALDAELAEIDDLLGPLRKRREAIRLRIKEAMGDAGTAEVEGGSALYDYKTQSRAGYYVEPKTIRQLSRSKS